ncbi:Hippurate hydrolase [Burkholderiales bacterium 8X]|nr:Hippurate hydrolase [Burkholderiales bacterium 8X]
MSTRRWSASGRAFAHIAKFHPEITAFRRDLHVHPELGFEEVYTSARVQEALRACGVDEIHAGIGKTGVVGVIRGRSTASGRMLGLRADMDALPMREENECEWRSSKPGLMHGCGHDGHTAMLVGAARYLAETRDFDGTAVLIFQPGEEGFAGARVMIEDGLFDRFPVDAVFAMHNWPNMPAGTVGINRGAMMAAADRFTIEVIGKGGHGAHAYQTVDPIVVSAQIISAVQTIVSRNVRPIDAAVISICAIQAGDLGAMSVVPGKAQMVGTIRTFSSRVQAQVEQRLSELCSAVAAGFNATAKVSFERIYPATINTAPEAMFAADVAQSLVGVHNVDRNMEPSMGAEDFSFMLQKKAGAYLRIGQDARDGAYLHNSRYDFNDDILPLGAALHAGLIEQGMQLASSPARQTAVASAVG